MDTLEIYQFIDTYIPGLWILVSLLVAHVILSTIVHIKEKDFSFEVWPKYMFNFTLFILFIIFANAVMDLATNRIQNSFMTNVFFGIQAIVYVQAIGYYINNILKHLNKLGVPVSAELTDVLKGATTQVKNMIGGGRY